MIDGPNEGDPAPREPLAPGSEAAQNRPGRLGSVLRLPAAEFPFNSDAGPGSGHFGGGGAKDSPPENCRRDPGAGWLVWQT